MEPSFQDYIVVRLSYQDAQAIVVEKHYLHRKAGCSWAFGLERSASIVGVVMFGSSVSSTLCRGICGPEEALEVIELTRLWLDDSEPHGIASWFVARALHLLPESKGIVVSFADPSAGHHGGIYQALNFLYTGLGPARKRWFDPERPGAHLHRSLKKTYAELRTEGKLVYIDAVRKHRYILFRGRRKKALRRKLRYPVLPYPKPDKENT